MKFMRHQVLSTIALFLLSIATTQASENDLSHRPKSFPFNGSSAVFVDFETAHYEITYDLTTKTAKVSAEIAFQALEAGYPIFDSVQDPTGAELDGTPVKTRLSKTPDGATTLRIIEKPVDLGRHRLRVEVPLPELVDFRADGVKSAFWTSDLDERNFLERYLPSNFEFDQVAMTFTLHFKGTQREQKVYTNGQLMRYDHQTYTIRFPDYFTASSIFFHTVPAGATDELRFNVTSIDGRALPAVVYAAKGSWVPLDKAKQKALSTIAELERDYGPFPHPSVTIYMAGSGGMEYCGATMTDYSSLDHELTHSYFARGVMPANGNAGWLDEAIASWRDDGYPVISTLSGSSSMSNHPYYTRITDTAAYGFGARFMAFLDGKTRSQGGLKKFLAHYVQTKKFMPFFVEEFVSGMDSFYQSTFMGDFKRYTFGTSNRFYSELSDKKKAEIHRKTSPEELKNLL